MEVKSHQMLHLYDVFLENMDSNNCAQLLEEEFNKMFNVSPLYDEHDCNVVSMNSLNIHNANDDCTSHDEMVSYKHVNFCGVHKICEDMPYRDDRFCKKHKYQRTQWLLKILDGYARELCSILPITCELCNEGGHLNFQCIQFYYRIAYKYCDDMITLEHYNELTLFLGYEEVANRNNWIEVLIPSKTLELDLREIYMYCAVNCNENVYLANYIKTGKPMEYEENTNERENISQYPPIVSHDESGDEEELSTQPISSIRRSEKLNKPTHNVVKKKKRIKSRGKKVSLLNNVAPIIVVPHENE